MTVIRSNWFLSVKRKKKNIIKEKKSKQKIEDEKKQIETYEQRPEWKRGYRWNQKGTVQWRRWVGSWRGNREDFQEPNWGRGDCTRFHLCTPSFSSGRRSYSFPQLPPFLPPQNLSLISSIFCSTRIYSSCAEMSPASSRFRHPSNHQSKPHGQRLLSLSFFCRADLGFKSH